MSAPLELGKLGVKQVQTVGCAALHHSDRKTDIHRHAEKRNTEKKEIKKERWKDIIGPHRLTDTHS